MWWFVASIIGPPFVVIPVMQVLPGQRTALDGAFMAIMLLLIVSGLIAAMSFYFGIRFLRLLDTLKERPRNRTIGAIGAGLFLIWIPG